MEIAGLSGATVKIKCVMILIYIFGASFRVEDHIRMILVDHPRMLAPVNKILQKNSLLQSGIYLCVGLLELELGADLDTADGDNNVVRDKVVFAHVAAICRVEREAADVLKNRSKLDFWSDFFFHLGRPQCQLQTEGLGTAMNEAF